MIENMQHISTNKWKQQCKNLTEIPSAPTALEVILLNAENIRRDQYDETKIHQNSLKVSKNSVKLLKMSSCLKKIHAHYQSLEIY
jgi:hypothetical protein